MALLKERTLYNLSKVSYHYITHVVISADPLIGRVRVDSFADLQERHTNKISEYYKWYDVVWDGTLNYMGDAYLFLKTHPDFADATDI